MKAIRPLGYARQALAAGAVLLAAACVSPPAPAPVPVPVPRPRAAAPVRPPADWRDAGQTPGDWRWSRVGARSVAVYGAAGGRAGAAPLLALVCDRANARVLIERSGNAAGSVPITLRTTSLLRALSSDPALGRAGIVAAALAARDPLLDAMAFSRGRFALEVAGLEPLYLPAWPEVSRVIEDCR